MDFGGSKTQPPGTSDINAAFFVIGFITRSYHLLQIKDEGEASHIVLLGMVVLNKIYLAEFKVCNTSTL